MHGGGDDDDDDDDYDDCKNDDDTAIKVTETLPHMHIRTHDTLSLSRSRLESIGLTMRV